MLDNYADSTPAPRRSPYSLRLDACGRSCRVFVPLEPIDDDGASFAGLHVAPGLVFQECLYEFTFLAEDSGVDFASAILVVNGDALKLERITNTPSKVLVDGAIAQGYDLRANGSKRPFGLVSGFARMRLDLLDNKGRVVLRLLSHDIVCKQRDEGVERDVAEMVEELSQDPASCPALAWMSNTDTSASVGSYSVHEGGFVRGANRSPATYLRMVEDGLNAAEAALPYLRVNPASRVQSAEEVVDARYARRFGAGEARWVAAHPEVLVASGTRGLVPAKVNSVRFAKSYDVYENRLCLAYLSAVCASLAAFDAKLDDDASWMRPLCSQGDSQNTGGVLVVALARSVQARQRNLAVKAASLRKRAERIRRAYCSLLPGVTAFTLSEMRITRTKTFKEVVAYSRLFTHIERYAFFGESVLEHDQLPIAVLRLDRAYETYVLYRILKWLSDSGFVLEGEGARVVHYGYRDAFYDDEPHVANAYKLFRADERVEVRYEPVVFPDDREGDGLSLRRVKSASGRPYTPDFVITVESRSREKSVFVLDAKYRPRPGLVCSEVSQTGETGSSPYEKTARKYALNIVDADTGRLPDAIWLISGLDDEGSTLIKLPSVPWAKSRPPRYPSGIAVLTPHRGLSELFAAMGVASSPSADLALETSMAPAVEIAQASYDDHVDTLDAPDAPDAPDALDAPDAPDAPDTLDTLDAPDALDALDAPEQAELPAERARADASLDARAAADVEAYEAQQGQLSNLKPAVETDDDGGEASIPDAEEPDASVAGVSATADSADADVKPALTLKGESHAKRAAQDSKRREREREETRARQIRREEKVRERKARKNKQTATGASKEEGRRRAAHDEQVASLVAEILDTALEGSFDLFFDAQECRTIMGLNKPFLRKQPAKDYKPAPDRENVYYYCPRLPTYPKLLERYLKKDTSA